MRVLAFSCNHSPFHHKDALRFLKEQKKIWKPDVVVCLGDEMDYHMMSRHPKEPDAMGAMEEDNRFLQVVPSQRGVPQRT